VCCSVLQCVAVCCSVLKCVAVCCSVLQCVAVCCSVLQCVCMLKIVWCVCVCVCVAVCVCVCTYTTIGKDFTLSLILLVSFQVYRSLLYVSHMKRDLYIVLRASRVIASWLNRFLLKCIGLFYSSLLWKEACTQNVELCASLRLD